MYTSQKNSVFCTTISSMKSFNCKLTFIAILKFLIVFMNIRYIQSLHMMNSNVSADRKKIFQNCLHLKLSIAWYQKTHPLSFSPRKKFIVNARTRICFDNVFFCLFSYSFLFSPRYVYLGWTWLYMYSSRCHTLSPVFLFWRHFIWIKLEAIFVIYCEYLKPL